MGVIETNIESLWIGVQRAKGTPAPAAQKHLRKVGGDVDFNRADGSENYSDLDQFGGAQDFVDTIVGNGNPVVQATPDDLAYLLWLFFGSETVATAGTDHRHTFRPGSSPSKWFTVWKRVGSEITLRQRFHDCRISQLVIECSAGAKIMRVTPTFVALSGGRLYDVGTEPATPQSAEDAFLHTEGEGAYLVDGSAMPISQFQVTLDRALTPVPGDGVRYTELAPGTARISCAATMTFNEQGFGQYLKQIYGRADATASDEPVVTIPAIGSLRGTLSRTSPRTRSLAVDIAGVKWSPDIAIAGNPDGGAADLGLAGEMRKVPTRDAITIDVVNGSTAYTVPS